MPVRGSAILGKAVHQKTSVPAGGVEVVTFIPWTLIKRGVKREIITPLSAPKQFQADALDARQNKEVFTDSALVRALGLAFHWQRLLGMGKVGCVAELAEREGISRQRVSLILGLTQLAPDMVESLMNGTASKRLTLDYFKRNPVPLSWEVQKVMMALPV